MSETVPMISLDWMLPKITLMSVEFSEKTLSDENLRDFTMQSDLQFEPPKKLPNVTM